MTDEQVELIAAASVLRTSAAELRAVLNFIGREVIEEVRAPAFLSRPDAGEIMDRATMALHGLASKAREFRDRFEQLLEQRDLGILKGDLLEPFSTWPAAEPEPTIERPDGTLDFMVARARLRK